MRKTFQTLLFDYLPDFLASQPADFWQGLADMGSNGEGGHDGLAAEEGWGISGGLPADAEQRGQQPPQMNKVCAFFQTATNLAERLASEICQLQLVDAGRENTLSSAGTPDKGIAEKTTRKGPHVCIFGRALFLLNVLAGESNVGDEFRDIPDERRDSPRHAAR